MGEGLLAGLRMAESLLLRIDMWDRRGAEVSTENNAVGDEIGLKFSFV